MDEHGTNDRKIVLSLPRAYRPWPTQGFGKQCMLAGLLSGLILLIFLPALTGEFFFDDIGYIIGNSIISAPDGLARIWRGDGMVDYWPLSFSLFWLEWQLFGAQPLGYHAINLCLHATTSICLWRILLQWKIQQAWLCALLFALHPANSLTASWIFQTRTTLAACLLALAVLAWIHWSRDGRLWLWLSALVMFTLSLLAKPIGILLPIFWLYAEFTVTRSGRSPKRLLLGLPFFGIALVVGVVGLLFQNWKQTASDEFLYTFTLTDRVLQIIWAYGFYVRQALFPGNLMLIHPHWMSPQQDLISFICCLLCVFGLLTVVALAVSRASWQRIGLAAAWFIINLLPSIGIFYIPFFVYAPVSEHYLYLAIPGALVAVIDMADRLFKQQSQLVPIAGAVITCLFGIFSYSRAKVLAREETVWQETISKNPDSWLAYYNLGVRSYRLGQKAQAALAFEQALLRNKHLAEAAYNLGVIAQEHQDFSEAQRQLKRALDLRPDFCTARNVSAVVFYRLEQLDEALREWSEVVQRCPSYAEAHYNLAVLLTRSGKYQLARLHVTKAIQLAPYFQEARFSIGTQFQKEAEARNLLQALERVASE